jgi:LacI family transcriptional regulator
MPKPKSLTHKDIARLAGVSTATVSYVLNNGPRSVAGETRERVLRIVAESGYYPNAIARSLRTQQTLTIGLVVPNLMEMYYGSLACSLEEVCFERGYIVTVCNTNHQADKERRFAEALRAKQADGLVFVPNSGSMDAIRVLRQARVPVVVLDHDLPGLPCVVVDDFQGGLLATQHLIELGHRRIGFIDRRPNYSHSQKRLDGYLTALHKAGLEAEPSLVVTCGVETNAGIAATDALLACSPPVTAIFAFDDMVALNAMHAIHRAGLSIPDDISVVGFDDIPNAALSYPPLTTVNNPTDMIASVAARKLFALLENPIEPHESETSAISVSLTVRQSTGVKA